MYNWGVEIINKRRKEFIMEVGNIPRFEQFSNFSIKKTEKAAQSDPSFLLKNGVEAKDVVEGTQLVQDKKDISTKANPANHFGKFTEVMLYNSNFGFNEGTKDFFVKVSRDTFVDSKYPTDEMLRLKVYLQELDKEKVA